MEFIESTNCETKAGVEEEGELIDESETYLYSLLLSAAVLDYVDSLSIYDGNGLDTKESGGNVYVGPLVTTKWTQSTPFNKDLPENYYPGCVVIAIAQIMAFNEFPSTTAFSTVIAPWDTLKTVYSHDSLYFAGSSYAQQQVSNLVNELGNSSNCDVTYPSGSSNADKAKRTLKNYGYENVTKRLGCESGDIAAIDAQLINDWTPVYMSGYRQTAEGTQKGHAWVIDGICNTMYHINWGWHSDCNGYYAKGVFNTASLLQYNIMDSGYTYTGSGARNYYHYFRSLYYTL